MALRAASGVANEADNCYYQMLSDPLQIKRAKKEPFFSFHLWCQRWYFMMFCGAAAWCQYRLHYRVCTGEDLNIKICHGIGNLICYLCSCILQPPAFLNSGWFSDQNSGQNSSKHLRLYAFAIGRRYFIKTCQVPSEKNWWPQNSLRLEKQLTWHNVIDTLE